MLTFVEVLLPDAAGEPTVTLTLSHEQRRKAKLRVSLPDGSAVALNLPRGLALKQGDRLRSTDDKVIALVRAASEHLSVAETADTLLLARAAYHLGNRHVVLRVEPGRLSYPRDHVLDNMVRELGLRLSEQLAPFEPEVGGYADHSHAHALSPAHSARG